MLDVKSSIARSGPMSVNIGTREIKLEPRAKVLCATSALSRSDAAVKRAHVIARGLGAQLLLLHVIDSAQPLRAARRRGALAHVILDAHARNLGSDDVQVSIRSGRPHETIAKVAHEWDADLIVLGRYRRRFADGLRGTSAERIARKAGRPVLVVNRSSTTPYQHVLLASDLSRLSAGVARVTKQLGLLQRSRASVVHALEHTRNAMFHLAGVDETEVGKYRRSLSQLASDEIDVQLFSVGLNSANFTIFSPQIAPTRAIEQVAKRTGADLVVLGSSRFPELKRLFLGSVSNEVLRRAEHDVLLVSPAAARRARRRAAAMALDRLEAHRSEMDRSETENAAAGPGASLTNPRETLTMNMQLAMKNPNTVFASPETLESSQELTAMEKRAVLMQWQDQLKQLLIADEESMLHARANSGANAECLRRVTNSMTRLPPSGARVR
jgi:nucleotide-binding universal stress UspA family protein